MFRKTIKHGLLPLLALLIVTGCDSPAEPVDGVEPVRAEVYRRGTSERIASMHGDMWYGRIDLRQGDELEVDVRFLDADNNVIPLGGAYGFEASIAPGHPTGPAGVQRQGAHLRLTGNAVGETRIVIHFRHGNETRWTAPVLPVVVHARDQPVTAELYRRGTNQRLAYVHIDHWHGQLTLQRGTTLAVDVRFLDAGNRVIALGSQYSVRAEVRAGDPAGIVSVASHGDHLTVEGLAAGNTRIVIHFWEGNGARWSTPPLSTTVQ